MRESGSPGGCGGVNPRTGKKAGMSRGRIPLTRPGAGASTSRERRAEARAPACDERGIARNGGAGPGLPRPETRVSSPDAARSPSASRGGPGRARDERSEKRKEAGLGDLHGEADGRDRQPQTPRELDRVFLSREDPGPAGGLRSPVDERDVARRIVLVVAEHPGLLGKKIEGGERRGEARRLSYSADRHEPTAGQGMAFDRRSLLVVESGRPEPGREDGSPGIPMRESRERLLERRVPFDPRENKGVGPRQRREWLAQPPARWETRSSEWVPAIQKQQVRVAFDRHVLIAVVQDEEVGSELARGARGLDAAACHDDDNSRQAQGQRDRLVSPLLRGDQRAVSRRHHDHALRSAAVTAREDGRKPALESHPARQMRHERRLSRAAQRQVADREDRVSEAGRHGAARRITARPGFQKTRVETGNHGAAARSRRGFGGPQDPPLRWRPGGRSLTTESAVDAAAPRLSATKRRA